MKYTILVGVPSSGTLVEGCADTGWLASLHHNVLRLPSCTTALNFNVIWAEALARALRGEVTHLAMTHSDVRVVESEPGLRWGDRLIEEMEKFNADYISVASPIKDSRGLTSCGIGDPEDKWNPFRRFTIRELACLPTTFNAEMVGYGDKYLIHNEALCMIDLRKPLWYETKPDGEVRADFNQVEKIVLENDGKPMCWGSGGKVSKFQETEDWGFSRKLWEMGANTVLTTRVELFHFGPMAWSNKGDFGEYHNGDEDTASKWRFPAGAGTV